MRAALVEAEQAHLLAVQERDRAERLVEARALPTRRLDEAKAVVAASKARLDAAQERWNRLESLSQSADGNAEAAMFAMRAPFDGMCVRGAVHRRRERRGERVPHAHRRSRSSSRRRCGSGVARGHTRNRDRGELNLDGQQPLSLGKPLAVNPVIDPTARTAEIRFALDNHGPRLPIGQAVRLRLFVGDEESRTAIPESAVVDDGGRPVVFVQTGGESFERRPVRLGSAADGYVHVVEGVEPGERVVHHGAYLVRLAAMSTQIPAHGHVH